MKHFTLLACLLLLLSSAGWRPTQAQPPQPMAATAQDADALVLEATIRQQIAVAVAGAGFTDQGLINALMDFVLTQDKARQALRAKGQALGTMLQDDNITDTQRTVALNDLRAAIVVAKTNAEAALKALDVKIGFTKQPRLAILLTLMGVLGDESFSLESFSSRLSAFAKPLVDERVRLDERQIRRVRYKSY